MFDMENVPAFIFIYDSQSIKEHIPKLFSFGNLPLLQYDNMNWLHFIHTISLKSFFKSVLQVLLQPEISNAKNS